MPLRFSRHRRTGLYTPQPPVTGHVLVDYGRRFNDWVANKTTGPGGDYPDGDVWMPAGTYYMDPFDLSTSTYARAFDASKPNNNWLRFRELDGAGTVTFDLRPESAASALGQTQTAAYNDPNHGGSFTNVVGHATGGGGTTGDFRWCFDGGFIFRDGSIYLKQEAAGLRPKRLKFHGCTNYFSITEWRRQFDFICGLASHAVAVPGFTIPNTATYVSIENALEYKGNYYPTPFRFEGADRIDIIRGDIGPAGDDGIFTGADYINVIGTAIHEVSDTGVAPEWHHPDVFQSAGGHDLRLIDCTLQGHLNVAADAGTNGFGDLTNTVFDRCWQGISGITGGAIYQWHGNTMGPTNKFGTGAPTTRLTGHYYKVFSNGMDHDIGSNTPQVAIDHATGETTGSGPWRSGLVAYSTQTASLSNFSVAVPTGVTVDGDGFATGSLASAIAAFMASTDAPHQVFRAAYTASELADVMADYGLAFD